MHTSTFRVIMISHRGIIAIKFVAAAVVQVCIFVSGDAEVGCIMREREALLSFKKGLIDEYGILSSWRSDDCCKWDGVDCSNTTGHVVALRLDANYYGGVLRGKVGSSLLELHHLSYLDLSVNDFGGNPIPEFIFSMKQLRHLYLSKSNFSGTVPPQIGNLTNLRSLDLSYNSLRITENLEWLSTSSHSFLSFLDLSGFDLSHTNWLHHILTLPSLQELHLKSCNLTDVSVERPSKVYLFPNSSYTSSLSILDLRDNQLTCSYFYWLSNISTSLLKLDMSQNALSCPIPNEFERFTLIEHLDLSNNMLEGEIPKSLGNLSRMRNLVLYNNNLRGHLDELYGSISGKGILESLEILDLADNRLNGSVPDLRVFSALTEVYLGANNFTGSIPLSLGQLSELRVLDLSRNSLEGTVSESHFIKLDSLKILDLSFNSGLKWQVAPDWNPPFQLVHILLGGCSVGPSFPKWIKTQRNFTDLDLSSAGIIDEAPRWLWSTSTVLGNLFLSHNQITGTIPDLSSNVMLGELDLAYNNFSGTIPLLNASIGSQITLNGNMLSGSISSLCEILHDWLWVLDLSNNELEGEVPNCWDKMPNLFFLNLADNRFWGEIPASLGSLSGLYALQLRGNNLSGEFPSTLRFCLNLQLTDVGGNQLSGEIPAWIGEMYDLGLLNLGRNKFHGSIPPQICSLTYIRMLDVSMNNLSGKIPDCFNNFTTLDQKNIPTIQSFLGYGYSSIYNPDLPNVVDYTFYVYSWFQWKGQESEYRKNLNLLKLIDLSSNRLSGSIPQSFSSMRGLISLNLSRNSLTGDIIPDIGEMEMLECLDLSHNQLSGKIPATTAKLQFLASLDFSNNNLSGKIPTSTQLQSFNASAYAGNHGLCGPPLAPCPEDSLRPSSEKKNTNDEKDAIFSLMQEVCISMAFGFILGFWGLVASFLLKKSWKIAYFNLLDAAGDRFYVRTAVFLSKWRQT